MEDEENLISRTETLEHMMLFSIIPMKRKKENELTLFKWKKIMIILWCIQSMFFTAVSALMKPRWNSIDKTFISIIIISPFIGYAMVLFNMFSGGWGREESRFWCHIRIMYLEGYNSMRWVMSCIADASITIVTLTILDKDLPYALWSGISVVYCYYILSTIEYNKRQPIDWEKYKNDFDVRLQAVHNEQKKNLKAVNVNAIVLCTCLSTVPWVFLGLNIGFFIMVYQILMCINAYRYASSNQTFVVTDTQYDIVQNIFRIGITWTLIWIC